MGTETILSVGTVDQGDWEGTYSLSRIRTDNDIYLEGKTGILDAPFVHTRFPSPSAILALGTGMQVINVLAKRDSPVGDKTPTMTISIYYNGSLMLTGSEQDVTNDTKATFTQAFDAAILPDPAAPGAFFEVFIQITNDERSVDIDMLSWVAELEDKGKLAIDDGSLNSAVVSDAVVNTVALSDRSLGVVTALDGDR